MTDPLKTDDRAWIELRTFQDGAETTRTVSIEENVAFMGWAFVWLGVLAFVTIVGFLLDYPEAIWVWATLLFARPSNERVE